MSQFMLDIDRWISKVEGRMDFVVRKIALEMFTRIIMRSPVDTGRFRGNWQVAIGSVPEGTLELNDKSGVATVSAAVATALQMKAGDVITLVNNLPYGPALERGHSKQAPAGMVGVTLTEFGAVAESATRG